MSYLDLDLKSTRPAARPRRSVLASLHINRIIRGVTALITLVGAVYLMLYLLPETPAKIEDSNLKLQRLHYSVSLPRYDQAQPPAPASSDASIPVEQPAPNHTPEWNTVKIKTGDTLASIFSKAGLNASATYEVVQLNKQTKKLTRIRPGQKISILKNADNQLISLKYMPDLTQTLVIKRQQDGKLSSEIRHHPLEPIPTFKSGTITSSLFEAADKNDIPENIIMELAAIFGWDIDFALDIRKGDQFAVVYNELFKDGEKIRNGRILSAEFINRGKVFKAVYYTDPKGDSGYFTPDGKSMRKAFLRSPVKFSHISSRFTRKRWHPVLSKWRSHKGVDYAAARGTPIRASGDGKVLKKVVSKSYGKVVFLQHGSKYTTVYAHMSRFARGIRKGKRVKQGQVIGYVGSTGFATGPHLHYEFRLNGVHRNPLTVKLPAAEPINKAYLKDFKQRTRTFLSMLDLMDHKKLAAKTSDE
jgi:murein DD-endopeptidase MepM/ murein hydrolase activator NlpD